MVMGYTKKCVWSSIFKFLRPAQRYADFKPNFLRPAQRYADFKLIKFKNQQNCCRVETFKKRMEERMWKNDLLLD